MAAPTVDEYTSDDISVGEGIAPPVYNSLPLYGDSRKRRRVLLCVASQNIGVPSFCEAEEVYSIVRHNLFSQLR